MMQYQSIHGRPIRREYPEADQHRYRELEAEVERLRLSVCKVKQRAVESLARTHEVPPEDPGNTAFVAVYEAHWRDREALFAAMRELEAAVEALNAFVRQRQG